MLVEGEWTLPAAEERKGLGSPSCTQGSDARSQDGPPSLEPGLSNGQGDAQQLPSPQTLNHSVTTHTLRSHLHCSQSDPAVSCPCSPEVHGPEPHPCHRAHLPPKPGHPGVRSLLQGSSWSP